MLYKQYSDGKLYKGDCLDVMKSLPAASVQAVVTSPPYNIKNSTGNGMKAPTPTGKWNAALVDGYEDHDDNMPHDKYVEWQRNCLTEMMRITADDGAIFYNHKWRVQGGLLQDRADIMKDFPVRQIVIWQRSGGFNFNAGYFVPTYEVIYLIAKKGFKLAPKTNGFGDVWKIKQEMKNSHPAPFPVELAERCSRAVGKGIIFDPFMGSGTTALGARAAGLEWAGCELSEKYCKLAEERIMASVAKPDDNPIVFS